LQVKENKSKQGLFNRVEGLVKVVLEMDDELSDEEVEGLLRALPADTARSIEAMLNPRFRTVSIAFMKMIGRWMLEGSEAKGKELKTILVPFNFPPEVISIFRQARPLTCEILTTLGVSMLEGQGERYWDYAMGLGIPDFLCSSSTIELGSILSGSDFEPDALVQSAPGACDANSKIHEFVSHYMEVPQFVLEKPTERGARGQAQYRRNFRRFIRELEEFIGEELDEGHMREVLEKANEAVDVYYDLYELRKAAPCPVPNIFALFTYGVRFSTWGQQDAVDLMRMMVELSRERLEKGEYPAKEEVARCMWLYIGFYFDFLGLFNWMEENGISYLSDVLALCQPMRFDTTSKETMLDSMADSTFDYPMTRQMGADSMSMIWVEDMSHFIKDLGANCAIYSGHHACKQTQSVISQVRGEINKATGVPVLCLTGDSWIRRMTPTSVLQEELSSFVDNVVVKKKPRRRKASA
jgi:benzoyl-CoA reductase/2-hydroxyglutaryl-CoA dehydratase subunit BcrC/BadD/HgdB